jgi:hypothetical protein
MITIKFTGTRPTNDIDFWWDSKDAEISGYCQLIRTLADASGISHSYVVSDDGLSFTSTFTVNDMFEWQNFNTIMGSSIPGMKAKRLAYFQEHQHSLIQDMIENETVIASHVIVL